MTVVAGEFQGPTRSYTLRLPSGALVRATVPHTTVLHVGDEVRAWLRAGQHAVVTDDAAMNEAVTRRSLLTSSALEVLPCQA